MARATKFNPKVGDLVYFRWEDHVSYFGSAWRPLTEIKTLLDPFSHCETVGFVVEISRTHITTVAHVTVNSQHAEATGGEDGSQVATRMRNSIIEGKIIKRFK